jgi:hypothetical protein
MVTISPIKMVIWGMVYHGFTRIHLKIDRKKMKIWKYEGIIIEVSFIVIGTIKNHCLVTFIQREHVLPSQMINLAFAMAFLASLCSMTRG